MSKNIVIIPARGGSKGLPDKNIKIFAGKPLIEHTIEYAKSSKLIDDIIVSTDSSKIATISQNAGASIIMRPNELSTDTASTESAIQHVIKNYNQKPKNIVLLQVTSPLRPYGSLDNALKHFIYNKYDSLLSICPTHKFFWKIKGSNFISAEYDFLNRPRRQDIKEEEQRFVENGSIYIFSYEHFLNTENRLGGKIGYVIWPEEYGMEIDSALDFEIIEKIYNRIKK